MGRRPAGVCFTVYAIRFWECVVLGCCCVLFRLRKCEYIQVGNIRIVLTRRGKAGELCAKEGKAGGRGGGREERWLWLRVTTISRQDAAGTVVVAGVYDLLTSRTEKKTHSGIVETEDVRSDSYELRASYVCTRRLLTFASIDINICRYRYAIYSMAVV